jgi:hypothetical protein
MFRAARPGSGIGQRHKPVQRADCVPHAQPAQVRAEVAHPARGPCPERDGKTWLHRPGIQPDKHGAFLAARRPVPRRQRRPQQVALQPRGLMRRVAADGFDPGNFPMTGGLPRRIRPLPPPATVMPPGKYAPSSGPGTRAWLPRPPGISEHPRGYALPSRCTETRQTRPRPAPGSKNRHTAPRYDVGKTTRRERTLKARHERAG